jgi:hypothetical protein
MYMVVAVYILRMNYRGTATYTVTGGESYVISGSAASATLPISPFLAGITVTFAGPTKDLAAGQYAASRQTGPRAKPRVVISMAL